MAAPDRSSAASRWALLLSRPVSVGIIKFIFNDYILFASSSCYTTIASVVISVVVVDITGCCCYCCSSSWARQTRTHKTTYTRINPARTRLYRDSDANNLLTLSARRNSRQSGTSNHAHYNSDRPRSIVFFLCRKFEKIVLLLLRCCGRHVNVKQHHFFHSRRLLLPKLECELDGRRQTKIP